jgi:hypothetical protein
MKQIWSYEVASQDLLKLIFQPRKIPFKKTLLNNLNIPEIGLGKCLLIVEVNPEMSDVSDLILISDQSTIESTLPKLISIPGSIAPVTAYCKVWEKNAATKYYNREKRNSNESTLAGLTGLLTAEIYLKYGLDIDLHRVGLSTANRMFSFSCAKMLFAGCSEMENFKLLEAWYEASYLTQNQLDIKLYSVISYLSNFIRFVSLDNDYDNNSSSIGQAITDWGYGSGDLFDSLPFGINIHEISISLRSLTREEKLNRIENAIKSVRKNSSVDDNLLRDLITGYLISLIDPGSMDFIEMALNLDDKRGYIALTYSMFAGILAGEKFLLKNEGFGKNIFNVNLNQANQLDKSTPDISLEELRLLKNKIKENGFEFRTKTPSIVEVELIPNITGSFINGYRKESSNQNTEKDNSTALILNLNSKIYELEKLASMLKSNIEDIKYNLSEIKKTQPKKKYVKPR